MAVVSIRYHNISDGTGSLCCDFHPGGDHGAHDLVVVQQDKHEAKPKNSNWSRRGQASYLGGRTSPVKYEKTSKQCRRNDSIILAKLVVACFAAVLHIIDGRSDNV